MGAGVRAGAGVGVEEWKEWEEWEGGLLFLSWGGGIHRKLAAATLLFQPRGVELKKTVFRETRKSQGGGEIV